MSANVVVERAARAIYELDRIGERGWEDAPASTREDCLACARAAIASLREPTEAMMEAAYDALDRIAQKSPSPERGTPFWVWHAMIDAALSE